MPVYQQPMLLWLPAQGYSMEWKDRKLELFRGNVMLTQTTAAEFKSMEAVEAKKFVRGTKGLNTWNILKNTKYVKRKAFRFIILDSDVDFGKHIQTLSGLKHISIPDLDNTCFRLIGTSSVLGTTAPAVAGHMSRWTLDPSRSSRSAQRRLCL